MNWFVCSAGFVCIPVLLAWGLQNETASGRKWFQMDTAVWQKPADSTDCFSFLLTIIFPSFSAAFSPTFALIFFVSEFTFQGSRTMLQKYSKMWSQLHMFCFFSFDFHASSFLQAAQKHPLPWHHEHEQQEQKPVYVSLSQILFFQCLSNVSDLRLHYAFHDGKTRSVAWIF